MQFSLGKQETVLFDWSFACVQDEEAVKETVVRFMNPLKKIAKILVFMLEG